MPSYFNSATGFATTVPGDVSVGDDLTVTDDATVADQLRLTETPGSHAATPTLAFGDGDTGFYESSDDVLNIVTAGTDRLQVGGSFVNFRSVIGVLYQNVISPSALTGDVTDYAPTGVGTAVAFRIDPGAAGRVINSLSGPTSGRWAFILNISSTQTLTLLHDDGATGTAANRFLCPNNVSVVIPPNGVREIWYDTASSRWRVFGAVA